jgi:hypothetical protein
MSVVQPENRRKKKSRFEVPGTSAIVGAVAVLALLLVAGLPRSSPAPVAAPAPSPEHPPTAQLPEPTPTPLPVPELGCPEGCAVSKPGCEIKGNISQERRKIYHLPGQQFYDKTVISPEKGERWFCTEQEARANGWRKSKR